MLSQQDLNDINKVNAEIARLKKQLGDLGKVNVFPANQLREAQEELKGLEARLRQLNSELDYTFKSFQQIINEMTKGKTAIQNITKATNKLNNISSQLLDQRDGIFKLSVKELNKQKDISKIQFANLRREQQFLQNKGNLSTKEALYLTEINGILKKNVGLEASFNRQLESALVKQTGIEKSVGLTGGFLKAIGQIPGLEAISKQLNVSEAVESMENYNRKLYDTLYNSDQVQNLELEIMVQDPKNISKQIKQKIKFQDLEKEIEDESIKLEALQEEIKNIDVNDPQQKAKFDNKNKERENSLIRLNTLTEKRLEVEKEVAKSTSGFLGKTATGIVGLSSAIKGIANALKDPAAIFTFIGKSMFTINSQVVSLSKNLGTSYKESQELRANFSSIANFSSDTFFTTTKLIKAFNSYAQAVGVVGKITEENSAAFARLTERIGVSEASAAKLQRFSEAFNENLNDNLRDQTKITSQVGSQLGVQINQKQVLEEVGKVSSFTLVQFKGSTKQLTEAVATAKALGTTLENINKIAGNLLNFEQSITNELKAELLLGKNINLERARLAALNNDQITLMEEINDQIGTFQDFQDLNVIQQKAYADALGMSVNEMSDMLLMEQYRTMNAESFAALNGEEALKRAEMLTTQQRFNDAILKLQDIVANLVEGPLGSMASVMADILGSTIGFATVLGGIIGYKLTAAVASFAKIVKLIRQTKKLSIGAAIAEAVKNAFATTSKIPYIGFAIGAALAAGAAAIVTSQVGKADDLVAGSPAGYGNQGLMDFKKGELTLLNNQDQTLIAGTDLFKPSLDNNTLGTNQINNSPEIIPSINPTIDENIVVNSPVVVNNNSEMKELGNKFNTVSNEIGQLKNIFSQNNTFIQELIVATRDNKPLVDPLEPLYRKFEYS